MVTSTTISYPRPSLLRTPPSKLSELPALVARKRDCSSRRKPALLFVTTFGSFVHGTRPSYAENQAISRRRAVLTRSSVWFSFRAEPAGLGARVPVVLRTQGSALEPRPPPRGYPPGADDSRSVGRREQPFSVQGASPGTTRRHRSRCGLQQSGPRDFRSSSKMARSSRSLSIRSPICLRKRPGMGHLFWLQPASV